MTAGELSLPVLGLLFQIIQSRDAHFELGGDYDSMPHFQLGGDHHTPLPANIGDLDPVITVLNLQRCSLTGLQR